MMRSRSGFTLVEILIVVVILGILAAIVVPQFTNASEEAKDSRLMQDLQCVRSQIELYKIQHNGVVPGLGTGVTFTEAMTGYTVQSGASGTVGAVGTYGPYLGKMPSNPYTDANTTSVEIGTGAGTPGGGNNAWYFNTTTGAFYADTADHVTW
jgi:general secretion pathway protein G